MLEESYCPTCMESVEQGVKVCPICQHSVDVKNEVHQLPVGTILHERFLVGAVLGEGGFGITYIGKDILLDMKVAIKEYYPSEVANRYHEQSLSISVSQGEKARAYEEGIRKYLDEARILAKFCKDPNIVEVRDYFKENNTAYIVMEFLDGQDLQKYLTENDPMAFDEAYRMLKPVMYSLTEVHKQGLIHRDISPANLMLLGSGNVKLLDFGTARGINYAGQNSLSVILKPGYAPAEQYTSHGVQGAWSDVYAMCATIYKLITGKTPENSINRVTQDTLLPPLFCGAVISPAQEQVLLKGLAVQRNERIRSMESLIAELDAASKKTDDRSEYSHSVKSDDDGDGDEKTISGGDAPQDDNRTLSAAKFESDTNIEGKGAEIGQVPDKRNEGRKKSGQALAGKKRWLVVVPCVFVVVLLLVFVTRVISLSTGSTLNIVSNDKYQPTLGSSSHFDPDLDGVWHQTSIEHNGDISFALDSYFGFLIDGTTYSYMNSVFPMYEDCLLNDTFITATTDGDQLNILESYVAYQVAVGLITQEEGDAYLDEYSDLVITYEVSDAQASGYEGYNGNIDDSYDGFFAKYDNDLLVLHYTGTHKKDALTTETINSTQIYEKNYIGQCSYFGSCGYFEMYLIGDWMDNSGNTWSFFYETAKEEVTFSFMMTEEDGTVHIGTSHSLLADQDDAMYMIKFSFEDFSTDYYYIIDYSSTSFVLSADDSDLTLTRIK
ncbi:MAG: serine/threonine protein kinase [Lachnospiraceae bacterium]|nr:serine/threonine protein kinase [Lachnospiraceae bacterium]